MVSDRVKDYVIYFFIALILVVYEKVLSAEYLKSFLLTNQLILLVALFAISSATNSIVLTKLKELDNKHENANFNVVLREVYISFFDQIIYMVLTVFLCITVSIKEEPFVHFLDFSLVILLSIFVAAIDSIWDSTKAAFMLLYFNENLK